jgi:hypothetical protein
MKISSDFVQDSDTYIAMATLGTIFPLIREIIQLFQNNSYFELLVKQFRQSECNSNIMVYPLKLDFG